LAEGRFRSRKISPILETTFIPSKEICLLHTIAGFEFRWDPLPGFSYTRGNPWIRKMI
jgi:hypothetical protein